MKTKAWIRAATGLLVAATLILGTVSCSEEDGDDSTTLALVALFLSSSSSGCSSGASTGSTVTNSTATLDTSSGCVTGVTTSMDSSLPDWIKNNFKCAVAFTSGTSYCFKSKNLPNHKSYYWAGKSVVDAGNASSYPLYEDLRATYSSAGTNVITSLNFVYTIPASPTPDTDGTLTSTQGGLSSIGITVNGLAVFNNAAQAPDTLATEEKTFDSQGGHPQQSGTYHHHAYVTAGTTDLTTGSNLVGIALDGYAIYGAMCDNGTSATGDDFTPTAPSSSPTGTGLDINHGHTTVTTHFSTATYHYHYAFDSTATISTLMGSSFYGNIGSVSN